MTKFKVGDIVRVVDVKYPDIAADGEIGSVATVLLVKEDNVIMGHSYPYLVESSHYGQMFYAEDELEIV